jgi:hypothetical protein
LAQVGAIRHGRLIQEAGAGRGALVIFRRFTAILNLMASCNGAQREDMSVRLSVPRRRKRREELADAFQALSLTTSSIPP